MIVAFDQSLYLLTLYKFSECLGHSSINVTLDTYSHVLPNLQKAVLNTIGDSILGNQIEDEKPTLLD